jgi:hypothetical protein
VAEVDSSRRTLGNSDSQHRAMPAHPMALWSEKGIHPDGELV